MDISTKEWVDLTFEKLDKKLRRVAVKSRNKIPYTTVDGTHNNMAEIDPEWWTNGFWGGLMWLMYKETGCDEYKTTAVACENLLDAALENFEGLYHDVGFMWHLTSGANYRITGDKKAYNKNLYCAATLASRFNIDGGYIRAWNGENNEGWSIIDCLMNLPLLYWASEEIGDTRFKKIAMRHADMALIDHVRADGSVNHIVEHNPENGEVIRVHGGQGYDENSCWSRGLAWAVYGYVISYAYTKKKDYLDAAIKTANYFIVNCAAYDYIAPVDFRIPSSAAMYYDSTAGLCTACGLLELAKYVSEAEAKVYTEAAIKILKATDEKCCNYSEDEDSVVQMGTSKYPHKSMDGVHIPIIYGDFFFAEALLKLRGNDFSIW